MANLQPPPEKKKSTSKSKKEQGSESVVLKKSIDQTPPDALKSLQLLIPVSKSIEFKTYAAAQNMPMNKLFIEMFEEHREKHSQ